MEKLRKKVVYSIPLVSNGWEVQVRWTTERTGGYSLDAVSELPKLLIDFLNVYLKVYCLLIFNGSCLLFVYCTLQTLPTTAGLVVRDVFAVWRGVLPGM